MPVTLDELIQDAQALRSVTEKYKSEFSERGYGEARLAGYNEVLAEVLGRDAGQRSAQETLRQRTAEQDAAIQKAYAMISMLQNAAKAAYGRDKTILKEFKVGTDKPRGVKELITMLEYLTSVAQRHVTKLLLNGMAQEDIQELSSTYARLVAADAAQENGKKLRNAATEMRDEAAKELQEEVFKARKFAQVRFAGDRAKLEEFKPIARTGRRRKKASEQPATQAAAG